MITTVDAVARAAALRRSDMFLEKHRPEEKSVHDIQLLNKEDHKNGLNDEDHCSDAELIQVLEEQEYTGAGLMHQFISVENEPH